MANAFVLISEGAISVFRTKRALSQQLGFPKEGVDFASPRLQMLMALKGARDMALHSQGTLGSNRCDVDLYWTCEFDRWVSAVGSRHDEAGD